MKLFALWSNLRVAGKIGLIVTITSALFTAAIGIYHYALSETISDFEDLQNVHQAQRQNAMEIRLQMLEARRSEKDFLARHDPKLAQLVEAKIKQALKFTSELEALENHEKDFPKTAAKMTTFLTEYLGHFQEVVKAWEIKGLDHEQGLQGRFRNSAHLLQSQAQRYQLEPIRTLLWQLRLTEKELALHPESHQAELGFTLIRQLAEGVAATAMDEAVKSGLIRQIEALRTSFKGHSERLLAAAPPESADTATITKELLALDEVMVANYVPDLERDVLSLRRHEKDYLLREDEKYVANVKKQLEAINHKIEASGLPTAAKQKIKELQQNYQQDFLALVAQNVKINGLMEQVRQTVHQVDPLITANLTTATEMTAQAIANTQADTRKYISWSLAMALAAVMISSGIAMVAIRQITTPMAQLTKVSVKI